MKINKQKTKLMVFNTDRKRYFICRFDAEGVPIEVVDKQKLLGVQITNDLKWNENTDYIAKKMLQQTVDTEKTEEAGCHT